MSATAKNKKNTLPFEFDEPTAARIAKWLPEQKLSLFNFIHSAVNEALDDVEDIHNGEKALERIHSGQDHVMEAQEFWESFDEKP